MVQARFSAFSSFSVSLDLIWQPDCLINMDGSYHFTLRTMKLNQVVSTIFTFKIFKQCNQMVVVIDNARF